MHAWNIAFHPIEKAVKDQQDLRGLDWALFSEQQKMRTQLDSQSFNHPTTMPLSI